MFAAGKATSGAGPATYIEDVFSTYLYTGNGTTQSIVNGIDLSTKGGLVWGKRRDGVGNHLLYDTARGVNNYILSNDINAQASLAPNGITAFNTDGFTTGSNLNTSTGTYVSWTFRKQPKFFDIVTYTGNGASTQTISHNLGATPGCIIVKKTSATSQWSVYHRSLTAGSYVKLNATTAQTADLFMNGANAPTSTTFTAQLAPSDGLNASGSTYVAYLFAHDAGGFGLTGTDNVISCGSYTGNGSTTGPTVTLGYEPQYLLIKCTSTTGNWILVDTMRGLPVGADARLLYPNLSNAEGTNTIANLTATGFQLNTTFAAVNASGASYIYIAIRRGPMKVPTDGTTVFSPVTYTGSGAAKTVTAGFPVDLSLNGNRGTATIGQFFFDRLRGAGVSLNSTATSAEATDSTSLTSFASNTAITLGTSASGWVNDSGRTYIDWMFRRAPSFFDVVIVTTNGQASAITSTHNLGVVPEMMIAKKRGATSGVGDWSVYHKSFNGGTTPQNYRARLNSTGAPGAASGVWNNTAPTSTQFTIGTDGDVNSGTAGETTVVYLFATCAGVSKVGSYTGNGSSQTINCGFAAGARFILIRRIDATGGDWYVWDTARGIVSGNDGHLSLNTTAAEVTTDDSIDPDSSGFIVNQLAATNINVNAVSYIYLAIA